MYAKLFSSLYQGTLRGKSHEILVFTNLLAHCDKEGFVDKHFRAIAEETGLSSEEVRAAIRELEKPDAESRSPEMEGRRIVPIDHHRSWGWQVVNYGKYRAIRDEETRRETWRKSQQKRRKCQHVSTHVNTCQPSSTHIEGDTENTKEKPLLIDSQPQNPPRRLKVARGIADEIYANYPRKVAKQEALKAIKRALDMETAENLLEAVKAYSAAVATWTDDERQFIPHPATWFNRGSYADDRTAWQRKGSPPPPKPKAQPIPAPDNWQARWLAHPDEPGLDRSKPWGAYTPQEQAKMAAKIAEVPNAEKP